MLWFALVALMSGTEIERAQRLARGRDSEREQFHRRYLFNLTDATVTQIEVITEFRRLVLVTEEHILRGDWMFSRSINSAQAALAPSRGIVSIKGLVRFSPVNTYIMPPAYVLAMGPLGAGAPAGIDTTVSPQYSVPFKARDGKTLSSLIGAVLESDIAVSRIGQTSQVVAVILEGKEVSRTIVDFAKLD
jgi:hypothetical protein